jgi:hypothetical protein
LARGSHAGFSNQTVSRRANNPMAPNPQNINSRLSGAMAHTGNKANTIPSAQNLDTVSRLRMGISVNF